MSKVYFIGAGPGDPELITVKGKRIIESADIIIYAGSLVNKKVIDCRKTEAVVYNSAEMTLAEIIAVIERAMIQQLTVARVHTGDPSIYGAVREQYEMLKNLDIPFEVIPGVSSFTAAAGVLEKEFTVPGLTQTVILTRHEGRTPVPSAESLEKLAVHQVSLVIFLSVSMIEDAVNKLLVHYPPDTPVAVVRKATWEDQMVIRGTLNDIAEKVKTAGIGKTALILVGRFLGTEYEVSKLYAADFSHEYRSAR